MFNTHHHKHDNSRHIRYPDTVNVNEHRAPTDESIRLLEEMHDKVIGNIMAKVTVADNLVSGTCYMINNQLSAQDEIILYFKLKINGEEFNIERRVPRSELFQHSEELTPLMKRLGDYTKAVLMWYCTKHLSITLMHEIVGMDMDDKLLKQLIR